MSPCAQPALTAGPGLNKLTLVKSPTPKQEADASCLPALSFGVACRAAFWVTADAYGVLAPSVVRGLPEGRAAVNTLSLQEARLFCRRK